MGGKGPGTGGEHAHHEPEIQCAAGQDIGIIYHPDQGDSGESSQPAIQKGPDIGLFNHFGPFPDVTEQNGQQDSKGDHARDAQAAKQIQPKGIKTTPERAGGIDFKTPVKALIVHIDGVAQPATDGNGF